MKRLNRNSAFPNYLRSVEKALDWASIDRKFGLSYELPDSVTTYDLLYRFYDDEIYPGQEEDEENNISYDSDVARIILQRAEFYADLMDEYWNSDYVGLYRALSVQKIEDIDFDGVGRFWAYEKSCARAHQGNPMFPTVIVTGYIKPQYIDWEGGFILYLDYGDKECEVRVDKGAPLSITEISGRQLSEPIEAIA